MWAPLSILYSMRNYPRWARRIAARKVNVNCRTNTCKLIKLKRNGWLHFFPLPLQSCCHETVLKITKDRQSCMYLHTEEHNLNFHCCEILRQYLLYILHGLHLAEAKIFILEMASLLHMLSHCFYLMLSKLYYL